MGGLGGRGGLWSAGGHVGNKQFLSNSYYRRRAQAIRKLQLSDADTEKLADPVKGITGFDHIIHPTFWRATGDGRLGGRQTGHV
jgi:hypothetical protein